MKARAIALLDSGNLADSFDEFVRAIAKNQRENPGLFKRGSSGYLRDQTLELYNDFISTFSATSLGKDRYEHFLQAILILRRAESLRAADGGDATAEIEHLKRLVSFVRANVEYRQVFKAQTRNALFWSYKLANLEIKELEREGAANREIATACRQSVEKLVLLDSSDENCVLLFKAYYLYLISKANRHDGAASLDQRRGWPSLEDIDSAVKFYRKSAAAARLMLRYLGTIQEITFYFRGHAKYVNYLYHANAYRVQHARLQLSKARFHLSRAITYAESPGQPSTFPGYFSSLDQLKGEVLLLQATQALREGHLVIAADYVTECFNRIPSQIRGHWRAKNIEVRMDGLRLLSTATVADNHSLPPLLEGADRLELSSRTSFVGNAARSWASLIRQAIGLRVKNLSTPGETLFDLVLREALNYFPLESRGAPLNLALEIDPLDYLPIEFSELIEEIAVASNKAELAIETLRWYLELILDLNLRRLEDFQESRVDFVEPPQSEIPSEPPASIADALETLQTISTCFGPGRLATFHRHFENFPKDDELRRQRSESLANLTKETIARTWIRFFPLIVKVENTGDSTFLCRKMMRLAQPAHLKVTNLSVAQIQRCTGSISPTSKYLLLTPRWKRFGGETANASAVRKFGIYACKRFEEFRTWSREASVFSLETRLKTVQTGKPWREFETIVCDALARCFVPPLSQPIKQPSTQSGRLRRDLILLNTSPKPGFWQFVQERFSCFGVTVEVKNSEELTASDVRQLGAYLLSSGKALGRFGLLVGRTSIASAAISAQLDLFRTLDVMILMLLDQDLIELIKKKRAGEDAGNHLLEMWSEFALRFDGGFS